MSWFRRRIDIRKSIWLISGWLTAIQDLEERWPGKAQYLGALEGAMLSFEGAGFLISEMRARVEAEKEPKGEAPWVALAVQATSERLVAFKAERVRTEATLKAWIARRDDRQITRALEASSEQAAVAVADAAEGEDGKHGGVTPGVKEGVAEGKAQEEVEEEEEAKGVPAPTERDVC